MRALLMLLSVLGAACAPMLSSNPDGSGGPQADDDSDGDEDPDDDTAVDDDTAGDDDTTLTDCPPAIVESVRACADGLAEEPDLDPNVHLYDRVLMCADGEPLAAAWDGWCAVAPPEDPACAIGFEAFFALAGPWCAEAAADLVFDGRCGLAEPYRLLAASAGVAPMQRRRITPATGLTEIEAAQLVATSTALGFPATSTGEAFMATDDDAFDHLRLLAVGTDRLVDVYTAHYGDTRVGRLWFTGTMVQAGRIEDGSLTGCRVEFGTEGLPCVGPGDPACGADHMCTGVLEEGAITAPGVCVPSFDMEGEGALCTADDQCAVGLVCSPYGSGAEGECRGGWTRRAFEGDVFGKTAWAPGAPVEIPILVSGVATVPTRARLDLSVWQGAVAPLLVELVNPAGTAVPVVDTAGAPGADLVLVDEWVGVPGDELAVGFWRLRVTGEGNGTVGSVVLQLDTRWD